MKYWLQNDIDKLVFHITITHTLNAFSASSQQKKAFFQGNGWVRTAMENLIQLFMFSEYKNICKETEKSIQHQNNISLCQRVAQYTAAVIII